MPRVSIIIPHYNGEEILKACLESLENSEYKDFEVILVDNHSSDKSVLMTETSFSTVKILKLAENLGFAGGCNKGIEHAQGEYICILNNDTIHRTDWLNHLVNYLDKHPETASVMPKILSWHHKEMFDYSGGSGGYLDKYAYPFVRGRLFEELEKDDGQYDSNENVFWCSGTAFIIRKSVLDEISYFDESFFAHMEEIDMHWRLHLAGYRAAVVPGAVIEHMSGWTLPPDRYQKKYLNHRNNLIMMLANYSPGSLLKLFPIRLILEIVSAFYALFKGDYKRFAAVFASQFYILFHIPYIINKHQRHQKLRKISDTKIKSFLYPKALVFQHYIKGKKKFSDL